MMKGFIYRTAVTVKELGERTGCRTLVKLGYWLRGLVTGRRDKK
jgi:hypothetical protein